MRRRSIPPVHPDPRETAHDAHDLRNLLASVIGHAELQLDRVVQDGHDAALARSLEAIHHTASKAAGICEQLIGRMRSGFAHPPEPVALAEVARAAVRILEAHGAEPPRVELEGPEELTVLADRPGLERAVLNLLWNAHEANAIGAAPGGALSTRWGSDAAGPWLEVADRGPGLPEGRLGSLAEPFLSGRASAAGGVRGLGLDAVLETLRRCGGRLQGRNAPGGGAVLRMEFPVPAAEAAGGRVG